MRNIMHGWPYEKCIQILHNTMSAMTERSVILIDDIVIPNSGAHWSATQLDMTMLSVMASLERSENQWHALLESAGLKIGKIYPYNGETQDSIIVAVPIRIPGSSSGRD